MLTGSSDGLLISAIRWSNGSKTWWPIYTPHSGYFVVAGDQGDLIHIEEHLQANPSAY